MLLRKACDPAWEDVAEDTDRESRSAVKKQDGEEQCETSGSEEEECACETSDEGRMCT